MLSSFGRAVSLPEDKEQKQKEGTDEQHQIRDHFRLQVLLVVWCTITVLELDFICRSYSRVQAA